MTAIQFPGSALDAPSRNRSFGSRARTVRRAVVRRPVYAIAAFVFVLLLGVAVAGPYLPLPSDQDQALRDRLEEPLTTGSTGTLHLAGTDQLGRDVFARVVTGARASIGIALVTVVISAVIGSLLGLIAGYRGGIVDLVVMRVVDFLLSFPPLLLAVFLLYLMGPNIENLVILLVLFSWVAFARMARAETLRVRQLAFVEGAVALGAGDTRIILRHILPHLVPVLAVLAIFDFAGVMLAEAGLSYLGLGVQPPDTSWGLMLAQGQEHVYSGGWWLFLIPGLALMLTTLSANLTSRWLQELQRIRA